MSEGNPQNFRTAVGGFHKGDVSTYIAKTAADHRAELSKLQRTLQKLQAENESLRAQLRAQTVPAPPPEDSSMPAPIPRAELEEQELRAYRRAEAAERLASQRAGKLYQDMQAICDASAAQLSEMDAVAGEAIQNTTAQFQAIHAALEAIQALVRTSSSTLLDMSSMIPDPAEGLEESQ